MPEGIEWPTWVVLLVGVGAAAAAITAVLIAADRFGRIGRWVESRLEQRRNDAIDERLQRFRDDIVSDVEAKLSGPLAKVISELKPNGGSSLRDAIDQTNRMLATHLQQAAAAEQEHRQEHRSLWRAIDRLREGGT